MSSILDLTLNQLHTPTDIRWTSQSWHARWITCLHCHL